MNLELIDKYLAGEASETETKEVLEWAEASPENRKIMIQYKKAWALTSIGNENEQLAWDYDIAPRFRKRETMQLYATIAKYAAVIVVVFGMGMALQHYVFTPSPGTDFTADTRIEVPLGQMANVNLPDGTIAMLNSGTTLTYNNNFFSGKRQVFLQGEAFFVVRKDQKHPFVVETTSLGFIVYGTSFNIEAFADDEKLNTTLVEGSLGVLSKSGKELTRLVPGENIYFDRKNTKLIVSKGNTDIYTSWREGLITFRNEKLKDIAKKIERWYNVEIIIQRPALAEEPYFGTLMRNKPIDQILEVLKLTSSLKYRIVPRSDKPTLIYWN